MSNQWKIHALFLQLYCKETSICSLDPGNFIHVKTEIFPQTKNATFQLDEMAKKQFLQTYTLRQLRCSDKDFASGIKMASKGEREINTRDWKWTES